MRNTALNLLTPSAQASPTDRGILQSSLDRGLSGGQRHDRISGGEGTLPEVMADSESEVMPDEVDISARQKMLSAVTGSLLTSLLGQTFCYETFAVGCPADAYLVTPLDVVRVRLQSQSTPSTTLQSRAVGAISSFSKLPPDLGVSACCREVFWVHNRAEYCMVGSPNVALNGSSILSSVEGTASGCAAEETRRRAFTSTLDGLKKIAKYEGLSTLWRGLSPTLIMAVPANVIYFTGYDWLRYNKRSPIASRVPDAYAPLAAGSFARITAAAVISPIEMFRTRLQASSLGRNPVVPGTRSLYVRTLRDLKQMATNQGYSALWRGLTLTLWRDVPFSGLYWWGYETINNLLKDARAPTQGWDMSRELDERASVRSRSRSQENHITTLADSFIAGAVSGAIAAIVTTPFDVGKTRQQVLPHQGDAPISSATGAGGKTLSAEERSMPRFLWHIFKQEGLAGLWTGWAARCLKVAPACAIMISSYEIGKKVARDMNRRQEEGPLKR